MTAQQLIVRLGSRDARVRARAALLAGRSVLLSAVPPLLALLHDADARVRTAAAFALRLCWLDSVDSKRADTLKTTILAGVRHAARWEEDPAVLDTLLETLGWIGTHQDLALLQPHLACGPPQLRTVAALTALGLIASREATATPSLDRRALAKRIAPLLESLSTKQRRLAAWAMATIRRPLDERMRAALRRAGEHDTDAQVRIWAVTALGPATNMTRARWLLKRLHDPDVDVEIAAIDALAAGGKRPALWLAATIEPMWRALSASHRQLVGHRLRAVLAGIKTLRRHADVPVIHRFAGEMILLSDATDSTINYTPLERQSIDLVHCAAAQLWDLGVGRPDLTPTCGTAHATSLTSAWRRVQVVRLIGWLDRPAKWKLMLLRRYLGNADAVVRAAAATALSTVDDPLVQWPLQARLSDSDLAVFRAAAASAAKLTRHLQRTRIERLLLRRIATLDPGTQPAAICRAISTLAAFGAEESVSHIYRLLNQDSAVVRRCSATAVIQLTAHHAAIPARAQRRLSTPIENVQKRLPARAVVHIRYRGKVVFELLPTLAPAAVSRFVGLARSHAFDERPIVRNWAQGSVSVSPEQRAQPPIHCELTPTPFARGTVAMVLPGGRDTATGAFFVTSGRRPQLDGRYTVFARVVSGSNLLTRLTEGDRVASIDIPSTERQESAHATQAAR